MAEDKREQDRAPITLKVDYKRLNTFFADYTKNISKGGTFIKTGKPLAVGTEFVFVLALPAGHPELRLRGEVVWLVDEAHATEESPAGMGIRFKFAEGSERDAVHDAVSKLMTDALGGPIAQSLLAKMREQT